MIVSIKNIEWKICQNKNRGWLTTMELIFELNKMCIRFPGVVTQAVKNIVLGL